MWNGHMPKVFAPSWISCLDYYFCELSIKMAKVLINNSYMNDKTCGIPSKTIKIQLSHILDISPTHATGYILKKGINNNNTSVVVQILKPRIQTCCWFFLGTWLCK